MPTWCEATWSQRVGLCVVWGIGWGVVFPAMLGGILWVLGSMADGWSRHNAEHDRCLKQATTGYEIKQCR